MRQLPLAFQPRPDADTSRPRLQRTPAEAAKLRKRHAINKQVYVKVMVRDRVLTEHEAAQQYDSIWGLS